MKICLKCLRQSSFLKNLINWISLMCQQKHRSLPMQKTLQQREKFLKNLWKFDLEVKNLIDYYIAMGLYKSFFGNFCFWANESSFVYSLLTSAACKVLVEL